jgi:ligand-binding sensor domain-containing protein/signal transduction histidine kinase/DNA-binding response OmpR family regulator
MKNIRLLFLFLFCLFGQLISSRPNIYFRSLGVEEGLSQNMVYAICQDRQGFMWFGTQDGLNRYDGHSFKIYKKDVIYPDGLKSDAIFSLKEDRNGNLWVGTDNGVYLYNPIYDHFTRIPLYDNRGRLISGIIRDIKQDRSGNIWLAISNEGVICITPSHRMHLYSLSHFFKTGNCMVRNICFDTDGNLWAATYQQGLFKIIPSNGAIQQFPIGGSTTDMLGNDINALCLWGTENLLVGTAGHGLLKFNLRNLKYTPMWEKDEKGRTLFVRNICIDAEGKIWLGAETGLYIISPKDNHREHLQHIANDPYSLSDNAIHSLFQDSEGGMWLGTYFGGVNYYTKYDSQFEKHYPVPGDNSISGKSISEFCEDPSGLIWIGTEDAGLNCFNPLHQTFSRSNIPADNIHALLYDSGKLWIGSFSKGLFVMDLKTKRVKNYPSSPAKGALHDGNIYSIYRDYHGVLWIGTMSGLQRYSPQTDSFITILEKQITSQVNDILEDFDGNLWFATLGQGIFLYNRKSRRWIHYPLLVKKDPSRGKMVSCLLEDKLHGIWIGTEGAGIIYYSRQKRTFSKFYNVGNGLPNNVIYRLLEDNNGNIWGSTNQGLFRLNPKTNTIERYSHADGLLGDQFNYKSGYLSKSGCMYFGGVKGFIDFYPSKLISLTTPPSIVFNSFQLYNVEALVGTKNSPLKRSINYTHDITLHYNQSIFSIGFSTICYSPSRSNRYYYKLEGRDIDWIATTRDQVVTYSNLPSGDYRFCVLVTNINEPWKSIESSITIHILPPFYLSLWAYLLYIIFIIGLGYYIVKKFNDRIRKRNIEAIKILEREKEKEVYDAKISFFTHITHEIRTPLSLIKTPLDEVMKEIKTSDNCFENLSIIQRNANRLLKLVNELLDFRRAEAKGLKLNFVRTDVSLLVDDTIKRFIPSANLHEIAFKKSLPAEPCMADVDVEVLTKIMSNLFNNALKHARSFIEVKLINNLTSLRLSVANDGPSIPKEQINRIFLPFVKLDENASGTGLGLPFAKSLVEVHQGKIYVDTSCEFVTFVIELPLRQEMSFSLNDNAKEDIPLDENKDETNDVMPFEKDKKVILSVEDNEEFQLFMINQLKKEYKFLRAHNGEQALSILSTHAVDMVISDIMMPVMDGMELCTKIKENVKYSHIPVILLTAKIGLQSQIDGMEIGADDYIAKPYSIDLLRARIENLLLNREKIRESYKHSPESNVNVIAHTKADEDFLNKLVDAIHSRLEEVDLDVDEIAIMMNMSRATLYRKVKSISELTPNDFIRLIRLKKAAELLKEKEYRVNEIAFIVGFNSTSYFSKCFYKQFGVLPKDFGKITNKEQ